MNELLLVLSLLISFGSTVLFLKLFGKSGLFAWIGICAVFANVEVLSLFYHLKKCRSFFSVNNIRGGYL